MKATILQKNFAKALNAVSRIVATRTTLPVLGNILISVEKGKITFGATDLEVGISVEVPGKIESEGKITIPARLLSDFVLNNNDENIAVKQTDLTLNLKSDRFEANIKGIDADEFPTIPEATASEFCKIKSADLSTALKKVIIAAANDETRPVLAGVYFKYDKKTLTLAATDSYRLAEARIDLAQEIEAKEVIVPLRTMNELNRLLTSYVGEVSIILDENQVFFLLGDVKIVSRLIEGSFPNYNQIIPTSSKITVKVSLIEAVQAIKMSALFSKDIANNIKIILKGKDLTIKSADSEAGNTTSQIKCEASGGEIEVAFNARYLLDALGVLEGEEVIFNFNDEMSPGVIKSEKDKDYLYLAMPLKLDK